MPRRSHACVIAMLAGCPTPTAPVRATPPVPSAVQPAARPQASRMPSPGAGPFDAAIDDEVAAMHDRLVAWRRRIHAHPELGNREVKTAAMVAEHLRALGLTVRTGVAHTGVVGVLEGGRPGPVVALRADMDALPIREEVDVPFASKVKTTYRGQPTFVMHACGHDLHTAILMGVAEVLTSLRADLPGTVVFLFQPAEEGPPDGEKGGAALMIAEGALDDPKPAAIFGLHVVPEPVGDLLYTEGAAMAASDALHIVVRGRQTHGGYPWRGIDPVTIAAQIVLGLQTIPARQIDLTRGASVVSIGSIHGGVRGNIVPDSVEMRGTLRTFDEDVRADLHARVAKTARSIAESSGATAEVTIDPGYPVTYNDPALVAWIVPTLRRVAGPERVRERAPVFGSEDFSRYQARVPGVYLFLGIVPAGTDPATAAPNHSPRFFADEGALPLGVRALATVATDWLRSAAHVDAAR